MAVTVAPVIGAGPDLDPIAAHLAAHLAERGGPVGRDEAEQAPAVLARVVHERTEPRADAA